jgi:hypothetical protein
MPSKKEKAEAEGGKQPSTKQLLFMRQLVLIQELAGGKGQKKGGAKKADTNKTKQGGKKKKQET